MRSLELGSWVEEWSLCWSLGVCGWVVVAEASDLECEGVECISR